MAIETLYATGLTSGAVATSGNALGAPNGIFTTESTSTSVWTARFALGDPSDVLTGTQTFDFYLKKDGGTNATTVDSIVLYENGSAIHTLLGTTVSITNTTAQTLTYTWDGTGVTNPANLEVQLTTTGGGGGPSARSVVQLDGIVWTASVQDPPPPPPPPVTENLQDQSVGPWSIVTLEANGFGEWTQVSGVPVTMVGPRNRKQFIAPAQMQDHSLVFAFGTEEITVSVARAKHGIVISGGSVVAVRMKKRNPATFTADSNDPGTFHINLSMDENDLGTFIGGTPDGSDPGTFLLN